MNRFSAGCACCGGGTGPVPDDGTGCCSYLPAEDIPGSLDLAIPGLASAAISGPFVYYPGDVQITGVGPFGTSYPVFVGDDGYYVAGPVCLTYLHTIVIDGGPFGGGDIIIERYRSQRVYAVVCCCSVARPEGVPPTEVYDVPRVRLFVLSNYGQTGPLGGGPPATCDDSTGGIHVDEWQWDVDPGGPDFIRADTGFLALSSLPEGDVIPVQHGLRAVCVPLCVEVDAGVPFGFVTLDVSGTIGSEAPCDLPPPEGCPTTITFTAFCPGEDCPAEGSEMSARDQESLEVFGPVAISRVLGDEDECLGWSATVPITIPLSEIDGSPLSPRVFDLLVGDGDPDPADLIAEATVEDCAPVALYTGTPPTQFVVSFRLIGCPAPGILPDNGVNVQLVDDDGTTVLTSQSTETNASGYGVVTLPLPDTAGSFTIRLVIDGDYPGYTSGDVDFEDVELPAAGSTCFAIDLGDVDAPIDEVNYVCKCPGLVTKCISWPGIGAPIELAYDGDEWTGSETTTSTECGGTGVSTIAVRLWIDEDCNWVAERTVKWCGIIGTCPGVPGPSILRRLARDVSFSGTLVVRTPPIPITPWGPTGAFSGGTATGFLLNGVTADPDFCVSPAVSYTSVDFGPCSTGEGLMMMAARSAPMPIEPDDAPPEPALPSRGRMARNLAKTGLAMLGRAAKGHPQAATPGEQARRWGICRACTEHFRPSDRRCGAVDGCGCWLDEAIPLAAKSCPLKEPKWGPEAPPSAGMPTDARSG